MIGISRLRHSLFGKPIATSRAHHERLPKILALPVFASDAMSSVAYATEAILSVLVLHSVGAIHIQMPITLAICALIGIVAFSYQQTIFAYPSGGGSYIVASDNLGETPGLLSGAALLIDYVLTVAVSIAAGVAAIVSAYPHLHAYLVPISILCIVIVMWANLRGVRESGIAFALPTYAFIIGVSAMIIVGVMKSLNVTHGAQQVLTDPGTIGSEAAMPFLFLILRSFAAGCTALTGIEAVSNGVPAFKTPESKNAAVTLRWMAGLLAFMFIGTGFLAMHLPTLTLFNAKNPEYRTLVSQIAAFTFGGFNSPLFFFIQYATAAILVLAANTSFADFPRLSSLMARDGYLPRQFARQGDRLVFQNGIIILAIAAGLLVAIFHGELDLLLPLYAVGVFTAFTLSQWGMVVHWKREGGKGWSRRAAINGFGAVMTGIVSLIILITKFMEGAWIVLLLLVVLFCIFKAIKQHYKYTAEQLKLPYLNVTNKTVNTVLLLVPRMHRGILKALEYARNSGLDCRAVHISLNDKEVPAIRSEWEQFGENIPLVILESPYRSLIEPILEYVDEALLEHPNHTVTVIVPEYVPSKWWHTLLHENVALQLKLSLASRQNVVVTNVRYFLD